jgi:hypothetical protein
MRWVCSVLVGLAAVGAAEAQVLWVGGAAATTWEVDAAWAGNERFAASDEIAPVLFVAFPLSDETFVRLQGADLPRSITSGGEAWDGRLRALTLGVDYFFRGTFGQTLLSAGVGSYRMDLEATQPPLGSETAEFGWYVGIGEWFQLLNSTWVTAEIAMHRTNHDDTPVVISAALGLSVSF